MWQHPQGKTTKRSGNYHEVSNAPTVVCRLVRRIRCQSQGGPADVSIKHLSISHPSRPSSLKNSAFEETRFAAGPPIAPRRRNDCPYSPQEPPSHALALLSTLWAWWPQPFCDPPSILSEGFVTYQRLSETQTLHTTTRLRAEWYVRSALPYFNQRSASIGTSGCRTSAC